MRTCRKCRKPLQKRQKAFCSAYCRKKARIGWKVRPMLLVLGLLLCGAGCSEQQEPFNIVVRMTDGTERRYAGVTSWGWYDSHLYVYRNKMPTAELNGVLISEIAKEDNPR